MSQHIFFPIHSQSKEITFHFDGRELSGNDGDTVIAALLKAGAHTGHSEFDSTPRAGFCLMGSCQDCTIWRSDGHRIRACSEALCDGMELFSSPQFKSGE